MIFPRMSLHYKLVPVQYREYEYGLLRATRGARNPNLNIAFTNACAAVSCTVQMALTRFLLFVSLH